MSSTDFEEFKRRVQLEIDRIRREADFMIEKIKMETDMKIRGLLFNIEMEEMRLKHRKDRKFELAEKFIERLDTDVFSGVDILDLGLFEIDF